MFNLAGKRPRTLGLQNGRLRPCPNRPNCVCSQQEADVRGEGPHHVHPFTFEGSPAAAWKRLRRVIEARPDATIITDDGRYLHAEFRSRLMGFVDDLECLLDPAHSRIEVRSASRLGYSDFGVNRARVEELREAFDDAAEAEPGGDNNPAQ